MPDKFVRGCTRAFLVLANLKNGRSLLGPQTWVGIKFNDPGECGPSVPQCINLRTFTTYFPREPDSFTSRGFEHSSNSNKSTASPIAALSLFLARQEIHRKI